MDMSNILSLKLECVKIIESIYFRMILDFHGMKWPEKPPNL